MQEKLYKLMDWGFIEGVIYSEEDNPHRIMGVHRMGAYLVFQTFQPGAVSVNVLLQEEKKILPMEMVDEAGYFAAMMFYRKIGAYRYEVCYEDGKKVIVEDAYRFMPQIGAQDTDKLEAGIHYTLYDKMGAHLTRINGVKGCEFAVWAPNALRVSVVGDFNGWDGRVHQMRRLWDSGIFEIFVPEAKEGDCYKFELKVKGGLTYLKTDPFAFGAEKGGDGASVIRDIGHFKWQDETWMKERREKQAEGFLYLSSLEVYGTPADDAGMIDESYSGYIDPLKVRSSYSEGKRMVECLCASYAAEYGVPVKIARLSQTFGAGVEYNDGRVFAEFIRCALEKKDIVLHTDGKTVRSYCYTKDAVAAMLLILLKGESGAAYNVTNMDTKISIADMAQLVCDTFQEAGIHVTFDLPDDVDSYGYNPQMVIALDSSRLLALGWKPTTALREMFLRSAASMADAGRSGS